jgi:Raf kinase inhibitor-like YbhB/YbcL family protein
VRVLRVAAALALTAAALAADPAPAPSKAPAAAPFRVESPAFRDGGSLPFAYACGGNASSLPLRWSDPPPGTRGFALIFAAPSAGSQWTSWVVYNIPAAARGLEPRKIWLSREKDGTLQGRNSVDRDGYAPPCARSDRATTLRLTLYALDARLRDVPGMDAGQLARAAKGHVLARAALTVTYQR